MRCRLDLCNRDALIFQQLQIGTGLTKAILYADPVHLAISLFRRCFSYCAPQTIDHIVIFYRDDVSAFCSSLLYCILIQRFDRMHIQQPDRNTFLRQLICSLYCLAQDVTGRNDRNIITFSELLCLSNFKFLFFRVKNRNGIPGKTHVDRTLHFCCFTDQSPCRSVITRRDHRHIRQCSHNTQILNALVRCTIVGRCQTTVGTHDLYIELWITNFLSDLLTHPHASKRSIGCNKGDLPQSCQSSCNTCRILLRNTNIQILLWVFALERLCLARLSNIDINHI